MEKPASSRQPAIPRPVPDPARPSWTHCPICRGERLDFQFVDRGVPLVQCMDCGLLLRNPPPADPPERRAAEVAWGVPAGSPIGDPLPGELTREAAEHVLNQVENYARQHDLGVTGNALLHIGRGGRTMAQVAQARGYEVTEAGTSEAAPKGFDVCVITDGIDSSRDPALYLERVYAAVKPQGILAVTLPNLDSWVARWMGANWDQFRPERLFYFSSETARNLLFRSGFSRIVKSLDGPPLSLRTILKDRKRARHPRLLAALRLALWVLPDRLRRKVRAYGRSEITLLSVRSPEPPPSQRPHKLSVVLPVFNEAKTFREVMDQLLAKRFDDMEMEAILVESNSTDGSREQVLTYQGRPGVKVILEDRPRGKGHAVRNGLAHATGDFILIQDADLEYDLNDYEHLLLPLRRYRKAFVLGSRHSGNSWKIRHFEDQVATSSMMNIGHIFFATVFNVLYRQRLKDPFTMYKVFRRDCLHDLAFEGNRFDFDCELVAKLVRRGYHPIEIPVNYSSRSFSEGKKISFFRDPPTYLRAFLKYRFIDLDKEKARERATAKRA